MTDKPRGFAAMTPEQRSDIARKGGRAAHATGKGHQFTSDEAREAGRKGGLKCAEDRAEMARRGKLGGAAVSADVEHMREIGRKGGLSVASDPGHMRDLSRKARAAKQS